MKSRRMSLATACALVLASVPLQALAVRIDYTADAGIERNDNVLMSANDPASSTALRAGFGFLVAESTSTLQANVGGRFEYWNYLDGPQSNAFEASLIGRLNWFFVPEVMSFTVENNLEMRPIDRFAPDAVNNRQRVNVLSLGPNVHFNWSEAFRGRFELRWIDSSAEVTDEFESERVSAALHVVRDLDTTSRLSLSLRAQDVDFDHDLVARDYRRYDAYARYQKELSRLGFGFDIGYTWVDYADGGSANHPMVRGDIRWQLNERSTLALGVAHQLSDTTSAAIDGIDAAVSVPESLVTGASSISSSIYKDNRADLSYSYDGERASFSIGPYYERIEYLDALAFDETRRGALAEVSYRLAPTWNLDAFVDVSRSSFPELDRRTEDLRAGVSLHKTWSRHWSSALQYSRYQRDDDAIFGDSRQNIWYLTVAYRNR